MGQAFKKIWEVVVDKIIPAGAWLINVFGGLENVILALIGIKVAGWLSGFISLLMGPLGPIILLIGGLAFLYDEIKVTMEGGESLLKKFAELPYIEFIIYQIKDVIKWFKKWYQVMDDTFSLSKNLSEYSENMGNTWGFVKNFTTSYVENRKKTDGFLSATDKSALPLTSTVTTPYLSKLFEFKGLATSMPQFDKNALNPFEGFFTNTISSLKSKPYDKTRISDFLTTSMPQNRNTQVTNNVGGIKIVIQNQGTIDENSIPKVTDIIQQQITKAIGNTLGDTFAISKAGLVS